VKEAPGVAANEDFWEAVDGVRLTENTALGAVAEMGRGLARGADPYRAKLGKALQVWVRLLEKAPMRGHEPRLSGTTAYWEPET
jgi:hypothetical protein